MYTIKLFLYICGMDTRKFINGVQQDFQMSRTSTDLFYGKDGSLYGRKDILRFIKLQISNHFSTLQVRDQIALTNTAIRSIGLTGELHKKNKEHMALESIFLSCYGKKQNMRQVQSEFEIEMDQVYNARVFTSIVRRWAVDNRYSINITNRLAQRKVIVCH